MNRRGLLRALSGAVFLPFAGKPSAEEAAPPPAAIFRHPSLASTSGDPVGMRLVCVFDVSGSVNTAEHDIQLQAMAEAIGSEDFANAIFFPGGPQSIAISVIDFGSNAELRIPWVDVRKGQVQKLQKLAAEVRGLTRRESGSTNQLGALQLSMLSLSKCPWESHRNVVDVITDDSGDGSEELIREAVHQLAVNHDATVNALMTIDPAYPHKNLEKWAADNLATKPVYFRRDGSFLDPGFVKVVAYEQTKDSVSSIVEYHDAMKLAFRRKVVLEVANMELEDLRRHMASYNPARDIPANLQPNLR